MRIAICDDERIYVRRIYECINKISEKYDVECELTQETKGDLIKAYTYDPETTCAKARL